ncbi:hypothetical protein [Rhodanobacter sp. FW106-PBR-R2A-1-13]|uniref:hypothetical protein n=1 Tax=Rhodanobacter sp. FW106-PBR-R2A-1-13 TaxID=3454845 RepID=UPI0034E3D153
MDCSITLFFQLHDEQAFRQAAHERALTDGLNAEEALSYLDPEKSTVGACAIMLFDPGVSPPGCSITDSSTD